MINPPIILAHEALGLFTDAISEGIVALTASGWVDYKHGLAATEEAEKRLQAACASRVLTMLVINQRTGERDALRCDYFEHPGSRLIFHRATFKISDLDLDDYDPLLQQLRSYNGGLTGFEEPEFRGWLKAAMGPSKVDPGASHNPPNTSGPKRSVPPRREPKTLDALKKKIEDQFPEGVPAHFSVTHVRNKIGVGGEVSDSSIRRAVGRKK